MVSKNSRKVMVGKAGKSAALAIIFDAFALDNRLCPSDGLLNVLFMTVEIKRQGKAFFSPATRDLKTDQ